MNADMHESRVSELGQLLIAQDPDPNRTWVGERALLDRVDALGNELLDVHERLSEGKLELDPAPDEDERTQLLALFVARAGGAAALLAAGQRSREAKALLERCRAVSELPHVRRYYAAAIREPLTFTRLRHAQWLLGNGHHAEARAVAASLERAPAPFDALAQRVVESPEAIDSAPVLFAINGFGLRTYGHRDPWEDGSYVTTRFVTALWLPLVPVDAYRVHEADDGYYFQGKVPVSSAMRWWRRGLLGLAIALAISIPTLRYLQSPERALARELGEITTSGIVDEDPETALSRYEAAVTTYVEQIEQVEQGEQGEQGESPKEPNEQSLVTASELWVAAASRALSQPASAADLATVEGIVARFRAMPWVMTKGAPAQPLVDALLDWQAQLEGDDDATNARLAVLQLAAPLADARRSARVASSLHELRLSSARGIAQRWPAEAIRQLDLIPADPEVLAEIATIVDTLPDSPALFVELEPELSRWSKRCAEAGLRPGALERANTLSARGQALRDDPQRAALLEASDESALRAALEREPAAQDLSLALAASLRSRGELDEAAARLDSLGQPGHTIHNVQYLAAAIAFERGELDEAAERLAASVDVRLLILQDISRSYDAVYSALRDELIAKADAGEVPSEYREAFTGDDDAIREAFSSWLAQAEASDAALTALRERYTLASDIVPAALLLGTVRIEQARATEGEARERLLADAERSFMAIAGEAQGMPQYHASLAQVRHRLGRPEEGDAQLQILIDSNDPEQLLLAAETYRNLGKYARARELFERAHAKISLTGEDHDFALAAAAALSTLATNIEDRRAWLERADEDTDFVRSSLLEVDGQLAMREGNYELADRLFDKAYAVNAKLLEDSGSAANPTVANNAAVSLQYRYEATGDLRHLRAAAELYERAIGRAPDNWLTISNYAQLLDSWAERALLDALLPTADLPLSCNDVELALAQLELSLPRDQLDAARARVSGLRQRSLDAQRRARALAPGNPEGYDGEFDASSVANDLAGLERLLGEAQAASLDYRDARERHQMWLDGELDENVFAASHGALRRYAALRATLGDAAEPEQLALIDYLEWAMRYQLNWLAPSLESARESYATAPGVREGPALFDSKSAASGTLLLVIALELAERDPAFAEELQTRYRSDYYGVLLGLGKRPEALAALRENPNIELAIAYLRDTEDGQLGASDLVLTELAGDAAQRERVLAQLGQPQARLKRRLQLLLHPEDRDCATLYAHVDAALGE
ncbi:hypothetical protein G6O69_08790 [Pseudenhygromyxa sp. WMMC2535]|uniref:hypothetical protein n=1 Tax=Pseudenhygromyxa sp. WMMC2535 TaxID=2712867 RepID=UPI001595BC1E|nr:hypothetical protein [Pseudenhygromyxa sp. WMMC2535]NVB37930.1 hypothetical protein [Pseudenhygromyxa sp. WMMC2535]